MTPDGPTDDKGEQAAATWARTGQPRPAAVAREIIPSDPQALAEDIERTRQQLGDSVEAPLPRLTWAPRHAARQPR